MNENNSMESTSSNRTYIAIDLKSFYASVECADRTLDPLRTNLVVADPTRTDKTICLAVSPSLKALGVPGRPRLFEVVQRVKQINAERARNGQTEISYIVAPPRMQRYMEISTKIFDIYLRYVSADDMHVYSVDEVFIDVTSYLHVYQMTAYELAMTMIKDVLKETKITATAGIGTNLYLCKVAMDVVAKHMQADKDGVRIAELDEMSYRRLLWDHQPITDFWRVGRGYAKKLAANGMYTMGDVARCSIGDKSNFYNEDLLYKLFGINAELLIDHAWGYEPCTMEAIKSFRPSTNSLSQGQVLTCPYTAEKGKLIVREMTELLVLDLVDKRVMTNQIVLTVGYDIENLKDPDRRAKYHGEIVTDYYGRLIPKHAHGTANLDRITSSTRIIVDAMMELYDRIVDPALLIRRVNVVACNVVHESKVNNKPEFEQLDLFTDYEALEKQKQEEETKLKKERAMQEAMLSLKKRYGKNAVLKGMNLEEGATTMERNAQIGGHKA